MNPPSPLRLEPRPSRIGSAAVTAACAMTSVLLALLPLPIAFTVAGGALIAAVLGFGVWRCAGGGVPAVISVGVDRRITVTDHDGGSRGGSIVDDSYVGAFVTTIVWSADGEPWWRPARAIVVLPDSLPRDEFRRLRVFLRYGRPLADAETRGDVAA